LKDLAGLKQLQTLDLSGSKVSAAGLNVLGPIASLERLILGFTEVPDADLGELAALKQEAGPSFHEGERGWCVEARESLAEPNDRSIVCAR